MRTPTITSLLLPLTLLPALFGACDGDGGDNSSDSADAGAECSDTFYADTDGDGYGDDNNSQEACDAPDGFIAQSGDCDDSNADVHPGGAEVCDGSDNDCNGLFDSADPGIDLATERSYFLDDDGDGYGDDSTSMTSCDQPANYVLDDTDCDDNRAEVNPGASEICDGIDNNCNSLFDEDDDTLDLSTTNTYYADVDGDGYGVGAAVVACNAPSQHAEQDGDCDDGAAAAYPGASELCDGLDNDCDGGTDGTAAAPNQCGAYPGTFTGPYAIRAQEKVGTTVINDANCTGSASLTIDLSASPAVQGTVSCARVSGGGLFDSNQSGTILGDIDLDGNISATLRHTHNDYSTRSYNFTTTVEGDSLLFDGTGSMWPHPMSAVAWQVTYSVDSER